jgi:hypothetical protein
MPMSRQEQALDLASRAAVFLYQEDPEFVEGGCSDVSEVLAAWLQKRGFNVKVVYGTAHRRKQEPFMHAWLDVDGLRFDPVLWVQGFPVDKYVYRVDPGVASALLCDIETIIEDMMEWLDRQFSTS